MGCGLRFVVCGSWFVVCVFSQFRINNFVKRNEDLLLEVSRMGLRVYGLEFRVWSLCFQFEV